MLKELFGEIDLCPKIDWISEVNEDLARRIRDVLISPTYCFKNYDNEDIELMAMQLAKSNYAEALFKFPRQFKKIKTYDILISAWRLDIIVLYRNKVIKEKWLPGFYKLIYEAINNSDDDITEKNIKWLEKLCSLLSKAKVSSKLKNWKIKFPQNITSVLKNADMMIL